MRYGEVRARVADAARAMQARGLTLETSGNVSARVAEGAAITPSAMPYARMQAEDVVLLDLDGRVLEGDRVPSVEHAVHLACYRARPDVHAVVHAHPPASSAFAAARVALPSFLDEVGAHVGDEVRVAAFAMSGSEELGRNVVEAMGETANAAFIASHGLVAVGGDLEEALHVAALVEHAARVYLSAQALGGVVALPADARERYARVFRQARRS